MVFAGAGLAPGLEGLSNKRTARHIVRRAVLLL
jgi:hypothetical protein